MRPLRFAVLLLLCATPATLHADAESDKARVCARLSKQAKELAGECWDEIRHKCDAKHPNSETRVEGDCPSCDQMDTLATVMEKKGCP